MTTPPEFLWVVLTGFLAQLLDGCVGMGYGSFSSTVLAALGIPPALTSATVHAAEVVTAGISGVSHAWYMNIKWQIFMSLVVPGVAGAIVGTVVLSHVPVTIVRPFVWDYLLITSRIILTRVILKRMPKLPRRHSSRLGFVAGFFDAVGGGRMGNHSHVNSRRP